MEHPDYPGYRICPDGRVWSNKSNIWMKLRDDKDGYKHVKLMKEGMPHHLRVHRLVAQVFIPNVHNKKEVNHKNGIRSDNHMNNLEWATPEENHLSIKMKGSNFGTVYQVDNRGKIRWRHSVRIHKKDVTKQFETEQEAKIYRLFLKYCFHIKYG